MFTSGRTESFLLVIRAIAPHVGKAVDGKGHVEVERKPEVEANPEGNDQVFVPEVPRNYHGKYDAKQREEWNVQPRTGNITYHQVRNKWI